MTFSEIVCTSSDPQNVLGSRDRWNKGFEENPLENSKFADAGIELVLRDGVSKSLRSKNSVKMSIGTLQICLYFVGRPSGHPRKTVAKTPASKIAKNQGSLLFYNLRS